MTTAEVRFPGPYPVAETAAYWQRAAAGRFSLAYCDDCERAFLYPRMVCPSCWGERIRWVDASGSGTVEAFTVVHRPAHPAFADLTPYVCAVVRLTDGPRLMTNLMNDPPWDGYIGKSVQIHRLERSGWALPVAYVQAGQPKVRGT